MKSQNNTTHRKKRTSFQIWAGLIAGFIGMMSCIGIGFYMLIVPSTANLKALIPRYTTDTELTSVIPVTAASISSPLPPAASSTTPLSPPTLAPTWTPEPTFTPFVLTTLQAINPASNSGCSWMENIEGEWVSDTWGQIVTFHPNGEYVQLDTRLLDFADSLSLRGRYECTSEGYIRILINGEEIFETSIVRVSIVGRNMNWTLVDDNDSDGHAPDGRIPFVKK